MLVSLYDVISCDVINVKNSWNFKVLLLNSGYAPVIFWLSVAVISSNVNKRIF